MYMYVSKCLTERCCLKRPKQAEMECMWLQSRACSEMLNKIPDST